MNYQLAPLGQGRWRLYKGPCWGVMVNK